MAAEASAQGHSGAQAQADTFPKLLVRNARLFADRPALRHKDLGIWQTWSWARLLDEVRAYAVGLNRLGVRRGDAIAIVGANRPKIYASVMAAQTLGAIPVPVYADAVANELAYVLAHAEVKFAAVEDQEQVDKLLSISEQVPKLKTIVYDEPKGLRDYDRANLRHIDEVIADGRAAMAADPKVGAMARRRDRRGQGQRHLDHPLHVGHDRPVQGRGAVRQGLHRRRARHRRVRQADRPGRGAGLSSDRLGRRPLSQLRAAARRRLLHRVLRRPATPRCRICARSGRRSISRRRARSR